MKQKINFVDIFVSAIGCTLLPLLYMHRATNYINPYHLNGKQFLPFFILLSLTSITVAVTWLMMWNKKAQINAAATLKTAIPQPQHCIMLVITIGIVRLIQGIRNERPVGYLVMLLIADAIAFFIIRFFMTELRKPAIDSAIKNTK